MAEAGVDRAVLVPLASEDDYVAEALREHPDRFAAVAVADAAAQGRERGVDPVAALKRRREAFPFHGVRTQWLGDPAAPLADSPMLPTLRHMAETGLVLWTYLTRDQLGLLEELPAALPELRGRPQPPRLLPARDARRPPRAAALRRPVPARQPRPGAPARAPSARRA